MDRLEVDNESKQKLFVKLCKSKLSGNYYLHIDTEPSEHVNVRVDGKDFVILNAQEVPS